MRMLYSIVTAADECRTENGNSKFFLSADGGVKAAVILELNFFASQNFRHFMSKKQEAPWKTMMLFY